jgi:hypothetical protein
MSFSGIKPPLFRLAVWLASAIALIITAGASGEAKQRRPIVQKTYAQATPAPLQQQKPVKLRYYGGPKFPMFSE